MSDTPETDAEYRLHRFYGIESVDYPFVDFARTLETQRDEARAEVERLRKAITDVLPGMKCQQPPNLGAWNWPWAVETLETVLQPDIIGWRPADAPEKLERK